jgi:hypothetical protein
VDVGGAWCPTQVSRTPPAGFELQVCLDGRIAQIRRSTAKVDLRFPIPQEGCRLIDGRAGTPFEITAAQLAKAYPGRADLALEEIARIRDSLMAKLDASPPNRSEPTGRNVLLGTSLLVLGLLGWIWSRRLQSQIDQG